MAPSLPATLPTDDDIFILEGMQPNSFSSFSQALEVFHPGNRIWNYLVGQMASGYDRLSSTLQAEVLNHMLRLIGNESRRILTQTDQSNWADATPENRHVFFHKRLLQNSNLLLHCIIQKLDDMTADTRYGYWRNTILFQKHISPFFHGLKSDVMRIKFSTLHQPNLTNEAIHGTGMSLVRHHNSKIQMHHTIFRWDKHKRRRSIPSSVPNQDISPPTWLKVGDIAEATFSDDSTGKCGFAH
jgi:hypothetical protein